MRLLMLLTTALLLVATPAARARSTPDPAAGGAWPLQPRPELAAGFDPPETRWGAGHRGVDLVGHVGQQVHTSLGGTVTFAAPLAGRGVVVVDHGGLRTTYEPVRANVSVGQVLAAGAVIGTLQRSDSHCFPRACLHWGLLRGDTYLNPLTLVGAGPIRLLPLSGVPVLGSPPPTVASVARAPARAV
jgi:murein DD-endopeptidase MepM/ murein hydrolase activator NlpD